MLDRLGWNFFVDTHGWPGGVNGMKKSIFFKFLFFQFFYHGQRRALQLVCIYDYRACHVYIWLQSVSYVYMITERVIWEWIFTKYIEDF